MTINVKNATLNDIDLLNKLLCCSKSYWGYDEKFMNLFMEKLSITKNYLENNNVKIAFFDTSIAGFYSFSINSDGDLELDNFFLHPNYIGKGLGSELWNACCNTAKEYNKEFFIIWSDPNAEAFYLKMGCKKIGERPSPMMRDRNPPVLKYVLYE
jgi:streptomycin 6-kinase